MLKVLVIGGVASLASLFILIRYWYLRYRKFDIPLPKLKWLDIVGLFNDVQMMPIEHERDWTLVDFVHNLRIYSRTVCLNSNSITLHACATKIKASSTLTLSILRDFQRQLDWNISVERPISAERPILATGDGSSNSGDQAQTSILPVNAAVNHDVIRQRRHYTVTDESSGWSLARRRQRHHLLPTQPRTIQRYWYREENNCCWLLEHDEDRSAWSLYVMQPCTEGWFANKCVLTIISCGVHYSLFASRLASLRDLMALKLVQRTPFTRLNATTVGDQQQKQPKQKGDSASASPTAPESTDKEMSPLQRFKRIIDEKRVNYGQEKRKKAQQGSQQGSGGTMADMILGVLTSSNPAAAAVDALLTTATTANTSRSRPSATPNDDTSDAPTANSAAELQSEKITANAKLTDDIDSASRRSQSAELTLDDNQEKMPSHESMMRSKPRPPLTVHTVVEQQIREMTAAADTTATCLIMEKTNVSHLNIRSSLMEQAKQSSGWTYCGLKKDVVVLRKMHINEQVSLQSYLGKGLIPCDPKLVFDIIRDPQNRTDYDELPVTQIDVVHQFNNAMKIVYMQYEVSQLFKKDGLDFCVLQSDKQIEGDAYVVTLQSVHWPDCPARSTVTRVKLVQSGWIIEPAIQNNNLHSMVTYVSQMGLGRSKSNAAGALDELASRQPMCIFNLRQYVTSVQMNDVAAR